jgi:hypothetical protein
MAEREAQYYGRALFVKIVGDVRVSPEDLVASLEQHCEIRRRSATAEVTSPPYHFFVLFDSVDGCSHVVKYYSAVRCGGARICIRRWSPNARGTPGKFEYHTKLSFDGLPEEAQEPQAVNLLLAGLDGELDEILPATDLWVVTVTAWLRDPCSVPKMLTIVVPAAVVQPTAPGSDEEVESPPAPMSPREKRPMEYNVIVHVKEVVDRGPLMMDSSAFAPDDDEDLSRRHKFETWRGKIDGTGPGVHGKA